VNAREAPVTVAPGGIGIPSNRRPVSRVSLAVMFSDTLFSVTAPVDVTSYASSALAMTRRFAKPSQLNTRSIVAARSAALLIASKPKEK